MLFLSFPFLGLYTFARFGNEFPCYFIFTKESLATALVRQQCREWIGHCCQQKHMDADMHWQGPFLKI
jgi:hypothetical protein